MSRSKFNNALARQLEGVVIAPKEKEKQKWTWVGAKAPSTPTARTTSSSLARALICGTKKTGHPDGPLDIDAIAPLLMQDIMDGLK